MIGNNQPSTEQVLTVFFRSFAKSARPQTRNDGGGKCKLEIRRLIPICVKLINDKAK